MTNEERLAKENEELRAALRTVTDHFRKVMGGPMISGQGVIWPNGVDGIPTIAQALKVLGDGEPVK